MFLLGRGQVVRQRTLNLATYLHRLGIRTLVVGFDVPDAVGIQLGLPPTPNMYDWFRAPSPATLMESIVHPKDTTLPDILLSPNDARAASTIAYTDFVDRLGATVRETATEQAQLTPAVAAELAEGAALSAASGEAGRIGELVDAIRMLPRPYTAIVMDLPPTLANDWALIPVWHANAVLLVAEPSYTDQVNIAHAIATLTEKQTFRIPESAIYMVLNRVRAGDPMDGKQMQEGISAAVQRLMGHAFAPPLLASIPDSDTVRQLQTRFRPVIDKDETMRQAMHAVATYFFGAAIEQKKKQPRRGFRLGPVNFVRRGA